MCLVGKDKYDDYPPARKTIITDRAPIVPNERTSYISTHSTRRRSVAAEPATIISTTGTSSRHSHSGRRSSTRVVEEVIPAGSRTKVVVEDAGSRKGSKVKHVYYSPNASYQTLTARGEEVVVVERSERGSQYAGSSHSGRKHKHKHNK